MNKVLFVIVVSALTWTAIAATVWALEEWS